MSRLPITIRVVCLVGLVSLAACDNASDTRDPGAPDALPAREAGVGDAAIADSGPADSGPADVGDDALVDSGPADSGPADVGDDALVDSGLADSGPADASEPLDGCVPEEEVCDGADNDCDGEIDEGFDLDNDPDNCGACGVPCARDDALARCVGGRCVLESCFPGHHDLNDNPGDGCEYPCFETRGGTEACDGLDNDCDGETDEDFDLEADASNCGACGSRCVVFRGEGACVDAACTVATCHSGYADADRDPSTGCECRLMLVESADPCAVERPGDCSAGEVCADVDADGAAHCARLPVEVCDGVDNDCDGLVDAADELGSDPRVGAACHGDPDGLCADPSRAGQTGCVDGEIVCSGPDVLHEGQAPEVCDGLDNDCDGVVDDNAVDVGGSCEQSEHPPCRGGFYRCVDAAIVCVGAIEPATNEVCNGVDDDCDGVVDNDPVDVGAPCDEPGPIPEGATTPCRSGTTACDQGVVVCQGSTRAQPGASDTCGVDADCNGVLDNQPDLANDVRNCGACGHDCYRAAVNANWACVDGECAFLGCEQGFEDPDGDEACEHPCVYQGPEVCNGVDDDCNGLEDDGLVAPSPVAACGVSLGSARPECGAEVTVACVDGAWLCTFPAGVCSPDCASAVEVCDGLDNDCDGLMDRPLSDVGEPCDVPPPAPEGATSLCRAGTSACDRGEVVCGGSTIARPGAADTCGVDADCDGVLDNQPDLTSDVEHCGACGNLCAVLHGDAACEDSECVVGGCHAGYADADGDPATGCECVLDLAEGVTPCREASPGDCQPEQTCLDTDGDGAAHCAAAPAEVCDGRDNDCDGLTDEADDLAADVRVGLPCFGGTVGLCADPSRAGQTACVHGDVVCTGPNLLSAGEAPEVCDGQDNDCDGVVDDNPADTGGSCGTSDTFPCRRGTERCVDGEVRCVGAIEPQDEICNGVDDDCDDVPDNDPPGAGQPCDVPPPPPPGATSPCLAGTTECVAGTLVCQGAIGPAPGAVDGCGDDSNCNGVLEGQPDLSSDPSHCGHCGRDCYQGARSSVWACEDGACAYQGCEPHFYDLDEDRACEYACFYQGPETCNDMDDDCNGHTDDGILTPPPTAACGVAAAATRPECAAQVNVVCIGGAWQCTFPDGVCDPTCASAVEVCDGLDNNCDGRVDENAPGLGQPCWSDDGLSYPGHGRCRVQGEYVCDGPDAVRCSVSRADKASCAPECEEICDGVDNDCNGLVDEYYRDADRDDTFYVRPEVVRIGASLWVTAHEISRPDATATTIGTGNGYSCARDCDPPQQPPPFDVPLDETVGCSVPGRLPWSGVTPIEAQHVCHRMGGRICTTAEWQAACRAGASCTWAYSPADAQCQSDATDTRFCNLGAFDWDREVWDPSWPDDQDGLLETASPALDNCWADTEAGAIFDMTGNLREITVAGGDDFRLMGGSFVTESTAGAACDFDHFAVGPAFSAADTGFRCCFDIDPR